MLADEYGTANERVLTVTSNDKELVVVAKVVGGHIGECRDDLLFRWQIRALLEFKVANCARQGKVSVDSAEIDKASSSTYPRFFA